jgi:dTDP-4-amino-4,6-dideoxygalactose transaminase
MGFAWADCLPGTAGYRNGGYAVRDAAAAAAAIRSDCDRQYESGLLPTATAAEKCANPKIDSIFIAAGSRDLDVIEAYLAKREAIAARLDHKLISAEDAKAEMAVARVEQNSEMERRSNGRAAANAALRSTMPVTCNTFGTTTTCY